MRVEIMNEGAWQHIEGASVFGMGRGAFSVTLPTTQLVLLDVFDGLPVRLDGVQALSVHHSRSESNAVTLIVNLPGRRA